MGAGHGDAFGAQLGDGGSDDVDVLAPQHAAFAGVRVETGDSQARMRNAEVVLQRRRRNAHGLEQQRAGQRARNRRQRHMHGGRHNPELPGGQHHDRMERPTRMMASRQHGQKLGVAGLMQAGGLQRPFGDGVGHQRQALAVGDGGRGLHDRIDDGGVARGFGRGQRQYRQRIGECRCCLTRRADDGERHIEVQQACARGERSGIATDHKRRQAALRTLQPAGKGDVRADAGRVAHRYGQRQGRRAASGGHRRLSGIRCGLPASDRAGAAWRRR
jgi:hypothetical protein